MDTVHLQLGRGGLVQSSSTPSAADAAVLITGATAGLGRASAVLVGATGRPVIVHGRRADAVADVVGEIEGAGGTARPLLADLADLAEVERALDGLGTLALHGIVTNAGVTTRDIDARSAQGLDLTFAVNVVAHQLVLERLVGQVVDGGRILVVSSGVHDPDNRLARRLGVPEPRWVPVSSLARPDDAPGDEVLRHGPLRYSTSKLANIYQARALQRRLRDTGSDVDVLALDPGLMVDTDLARELPGPLRTVFRVVGRAATPFVDNMRLTRTTAEHVRSLLLDDRWSGRGFAYVDGGTVRPPSLEALNDDRAEELWLGASALVREFTAVD